MKIRIEFDECLQEEEIIIRCPSLSERVQKIQKILSEAENLQEKMLLFKNETEYYLNLDDILFFETGIQGIEAHTIDNIFQTKFKLYELEEILPRFFMRISKSTIANLDYIYSITRNLTASSMVEFRDSKKKTMVSRSYYKLLLERLNTRKLGR